VRLTRYPSVSIVRAARPYTPGSGADSYCHINGSAAASTTEANHQSKSTRPATYRALRAYISANTLSAGTVNITLRIAGASSALTIPVTQATGTGWVEDLTNSAAAAKDDLVNYLLSGAGTTGSITVTTIQMEERLLV
jgi:hypothetical protein